MPIYAYKCDACGFAKDVLQKVSDAPLTTCPSCGAEAFRKQLTAAGFQLKGSGWYVTDFKGGKGPADKGGADKAGGEKAAGDGKASEGAKPAEAKPAESAGAKETAAPAAAPAPASKPPADK